MVALAEREATPTAAVVPADGAAVAERDAADEVVAAAVAAPVADDEVAAAAPLVVVRGATARVEMVVLLMALSVTAWLDEEHIAGWERQHVPE